MRKPSCPDNNAFENSLPLAAVLDEFLSSTRACISAWVGSFEDDDREHSFHVSGGGCLRKDILTKEKAPQTPMQGTSARRFAVGHIVEALLDKAMEWKGISRGKQIRLWSDWALRPGRGHRWVIGDEPGQRKMDLSDCLVVGMLDHIVEWQGRRFIVDWKTCHEGAFFWADRKINESYATQIAGYWDLYERQYGEQIDGARLVYVEKNTLRLKQVGISRDPWVGKARERQKAQRNAWEARRDIGALPPELPFKGENGSSKPEWLCDPRYCGFCLSKFPDGKYVCPAAAAFWEAQVKDANAKGEYSGFAGELIKVGGNGSGNGTPPKELVGVSK